MDLTRDRRRRPTGLSLLLLAAALVHPAFVGGLYLLRHSAPASSHIRTDDRGLYLNSDSILYHERAAAVADALRRDGVLASMDVAAPLHVRLYALSYALFGPVLGRNIVGAEPLNLAYYLAILALVYGLGREVFDRRVGLAAAAIVAVWPSFLLHTTQLLRDPLYLVALLAMMLGGTLRLTRTYKVPAGVLAGVAGGLVCLVLRLVRFNWWPLTLAIVLLGVALFAVRQLLERKALAGHWAEVGVLLGCNAAIVASLGVFTAHRLDAPPGDPHRASGGDAPTREGRPPLGWARLARGIGVRRGRALAMYSGAGSNVDADVRFADAGDVARYLPRAVAVGLFAPFPDMWFVAGKDAGLPLRLLAGLETSLLYIIEGFALAGLWSGRRRLAPWWLALVILATMTVLALVMPNVGALYRMRFGYGIMMLVLAAQGLKVACAVSRRSTRRTTNVRSETDSDRPGTTRPSAIVRRPSARLPVAAAERPRGDRLAP